MNGTHDDREFRNLREENANLRAEVERLTDKLERRDQEYQRLYAQRDRIHAKHLQARAEVERLQERWDAHVARAKWEEERTCEFAVSDPCRACEACNLVDSERDALAGEDGEG